MTKSKIFLQSTVGSLRPSHLQTNEEFGLAMQISNIQIQKGRKKIQNKSTQLFSVLSRTLPSNPRENSFPLEISPFLLDDLT
jgi:hypothetical protein